MGNAEFLHLVIGTAGHIDHGKSALVERLTGQHPDTLKEERDRGLTINLGYATFTLADGREVGVIDVPGHERFIRNMVAGASGMQFVLFVIAADDSIMPQSREHFDILRILGVERGLVALTKVDLVDEETIEIAREEIREFVAGSFLEEAPILPVSSMTGQGFDRLREVLEGALADVVPRSSDLPFRMPVQRVFSASGHGTVATGVPVSGKLRAGDTVEVLPQGARSRVRGLQAYGHAIEEAVAGHRAAVNLADIDYQDIGRGVVVAEPDRYRETTSVEARLEYPKSHPRPLKHLAAIRFLTGTLETVGRVSLLDRRALEPGGSALVQFFLDDPVIVAEGDRYILRSISPMHTIGGGVVLGSAEHRHRRMRDFTLEHLGRKERAIEARDREGYLAELVYGRGRSAVSASEVRTDLHCATGEIAKMLSRLVERGVAVPLSGGRTHLHASILERLQEEITQAAAALHEESPQSLFVSLRDLIQRTGLDRKFLEEVVAVLAERGSLRRGREGRVGLPQFAPALTPRQQEIRDRIEALFRESFLSPPRRGDVAGAVDAGPGETERLLRLLQDEGRLVRLRDDRIFHCETLDRARGTLEGALRERGPLTAAEIKEYLDTSRKNLIPLLEHFDQEGTTVRNGDYRSLPSQEVTTRESTP